MLGQMVTKITISKNHILNQNRCTLIDNCFILKANVSQWRKGNDSLDSPEHNTISTTMSFLVKLTHHQKYIQC